MEVVLVKKAGSFKSALLIVLMLFCVLQLNEAARQWWPVAKGEEGFQGGMTLVNTAGVVSSNGTTSVTVLTFPNGYAPPPTHRFWCGGITIFNTDSVAHTPTLVSHYSRRVMWACPLPAASGVILDNVNMLASDQGTNTHPEGVDMILEGGGGTAVGIVGQGYYK